MTTTITEPNSDFIAGIARGDYVCIRQAADVLALGYWTARRRLRREAVPIYPLRGRRYVSLAELSRPALRVA